MAWIGLLTPLLVLGALAALVVSAARRKRREGAVEPLSPRELFVHLLASVTLYISVVGTLTLVWGLADYWYPDSLQAPGLTDAGPVRFGISAAVVSFPIFVYLVIRTRRKIRYGDIEAGSGARMGFIYFNLFVMTVLGLFDLMVTLNAFLNGDLTPRFLVKAGGVLGIVALVFLYFRAELALDSSGAGSSPERGPEVIA